MFQKLFFAMFLVLFGGVAWADVVPPPPKNCPTGSTGSTGHAGPYCRPHTCKDGSECGKDGSLVCRQYALCVESVTTHCGKGGMCTLEKVQGPCDAQGKCKVGTCTKADYCVPPSAGEPGKEPGKEPPPEPGKEPATPDKKAPEKPADRGAATDARAQDDKPQDRSTPGGDPAPKDQPAPGDAPASADNAPQDTGGSADKNTGSPADQSSQDKAPPSKGCGCDQSSPLMGGFVFLLAFVFLYMLGASKQSARQRIRKK